MPLQILHTDITTVSCDAIVNPTDSSFSGSGGTDLAIHLAAGCELRLACSRLRPLEPGETVSTPAFQLPCKSIIHTVGPVWSGGDRNETTLLRSCYLNSLLEAVRLKAQSVAFPLISAGTFGFPKDRVLRIATQAISDYLLSADGDMLVYLCILDRDSYELSEAGTLNAFLNRSTHTKNVIAPSVKAANKQPLVKQKRKEYDDCSDCSPVVFHERATRFSLAADLKPSVSLSDWIKKQDDSFAVMLMKLIDKKGMDDVACYKKANVSKNTFSKIRNSKDYRPSKQTVLAFAIALELTLEETEALLKSAGFALSRNNDFDMIIEYFILNGEYNVFVINEALYKHDAPCLGC